MLGFFYAKVKKVYFSLANLLLSGIMRVRIQVQFLVRQDFPCLAQYFGAGLFLCEIVA